MSKKQTWILALSIALPICILTGYQMTENYTMTMSQLPLYHPSESTLTDKIQLAHYNPPVFQENEQQKAQTERTPLPKPLRPLVLSPFPTIQINRQETTRIITQQPSKRVLVTKKETALDTQMISTLKSHSDKDPIWKNLNQFQPATHLELSHTNHVSKKTKQKKKSPSTPYAMMNEITPDMESNLGYTK